MEGRAPLCPKLWTILVIAAVVLLCFLLPEKPVSSDVMDMLPNIGSNRAVSKELTKRLDSQLIFAVKGDKAAESLNASLNHAPFLSNLRGQLNEENLLTFAKTINNHPIAFLSIKDIKLLENPQDYSRRILSALYSPFGAPSKGELDQDPLLLTRAALLSFPKQRISMEDGWLTVKEGAIKWRLLFASLKDNNSFEELKNSADSISKMISKAKASESGAEIYVQGAPLYSLAAGLTGSERPLQARNAFTYRFNTAPLNCLSQHSTFISLSAFYRCRTCLWSNRRHSFLRALACYNACHVHQHYRVVHRLYGLFHSCPHGSP